jgi:hypothetical protein
MKLSVGPCASMNEALAELRERRALTFPASFCQERLWFFD